MRQTPINNQHLKNFNCSFIVYSFNIPPKTIKCFAVEDRFLSKSGRLRNTPKSMSVNSLENESVTYKIIFWCTLAL